ncbi:zinc-binding dehydrogenase [Candidatus Gracilibacteria bacterium]|nr:zinc-binding dehydrogenase [Candidatus Gracilibacteria bacterium]
MKAIQITEFGAPEVLVYTELPTPQAGEGEILIKVESAAVNFADVMRRAALTYPFPTPLPFIPGSEVAGTVAALGPGVDEPAIGTAVFALAGAGSNGYAQYAVAPAGQVIPIPPTLNADEACALTVAGLTAALLLSEVTQLQAGESVLIPGAGGGVGSFAIQIARLLGAGTIIGAASSAIKQAAAHAAGAHHVFDYTQPDWPEQVRALTGGRGVDVVLEMSGGTVFAQSLRCLAPFGRAAIYGMASGTPLSFDAAILKHSSTIQRRTSRYTFLIWGCGLACARKQRWQRCNGSSATPPLVRSASRWHAPCHLLRPPRRIACLKRAPPPAKLFLSPGCRCDCRLRVTQEPRIRGSVKSPASCPSWLPWLAGNVIRAAGAVKRETGSLKQLSMAAQITFHAGMFSIIHFTRGILNSEFGILTPDSGLLTPTLRHINAKTGQLKRLAQLALRQIDLGHKALVVFAIHQQQRRFIALRLAIEHVDAFDEHGVTLAACLGKRQRLPIGTV